MAYHWRDGLFFERLPDGTVHIFERSDKEPSDAPPTFSVEIPPDEWASVVASVSVQGDVVQAWDAARKLHNG